MAVASDAVEDRRRFGGELRQLREKAGRTLDEAAARLECSSAKISRIETGQVAVRPLDLRELLDFYEVTGARRAAMLAVSRQRGKRLEFDGVIYDGYHLYLGYEEEAVEIREYQPQWIPGLLQTREYALALSLAAGSTPEIAERRAGLRMDRQGRLRRENSPRLSVVVDEYALRRPVPEPGLMAAQLRHLAETAGDPHVSVRVLPSSAGMHPAQAGGFILLGFPLPDDPNIVYTDDLTEGRLTQEPARVAQYVTAFERVQALALGPAESVELIHDVAGSHS
ncbi:helix-turn-helix transcriptional regulator [Amycolatopsis sp. NPDC051071]|uniref:helix-turn-helix domain-containing protein n=1 Tax=Amycolatopsis sp. NPDC051071 TaxID=3154637 RepID=UPI00341D9131